MDVLSQYSYKDLTCDLSEETNEPEIGKMFSVEIKKESSYYIYFRGGLKMFCFVLVFVKVDGV